MIVNILNRNYAPSPGITGESAAELAAWLSSNNKQVNIISVDAHYQGGGESLYQAGRIFRIATFYNGKRAILRLLGNLYEGFFMIKKSNALRPDITICMTDPPMLQFWASLFLGRKKKWILWSMDLYPEAFAAGNYLSSKNILYKKIQDRQVKAGPDHCISLGPFQAAYLKTVFGPETGFTQLPCGIFNPEESDAARPEWAKQSGKICLGYCGNLGEAHSLEFLLAVIDHINPEKHKLILAVYGSKAPALLKAASGKQGIEIILSVKRAELKYIDVHLVSLLKDWINVCVPSKSVSSVCAGAAFLYYGFRNSDNWELLKGAGWILEGNGPLNEQVREFLQNLNMEMIADKKKAALQISAGLQEMKANAFREINLRIDELVREKNPL